MAIDVFAIKMCVIFQVRDASYGSSSDSECEADGAEHWGVARLLYVGLGVLSLGLVVYFVGTGDKVLGPRHPIEALVKSVIGPEI